MNDWGLIGVLIFCLLAGFQFVANFIIDPLIKKRKGLEYKINKPIIAFTILYMLFMSTVLILAISGFFKYNE